MSSIICRLSLTSFFFFFNDTAPPEIYPLSLHDALPISAQGPATSSELAARAGLDERYVREWLGAMATGGVVDYDAATSRFTLPAEHAQGDRKSTRLNSSHSQISYAVFCLKKKNNKAATTANQGEYFIVQQNTC